jgi:DNA polymerase-1
VLPCADLEALFRRWEFTSLVKRVRALAGSSDGPEREMTSPDVGAAAGPATPGVICDSSGSAAAGRPATVADLQSALDLSLEPPRPIAAPLPPVVLEEGAGPPAAVLEKGECGFAVVPVVDRPEEAAERFAVAADDGGGRVLAALVGAPALRGLWRAAPHVVGHDVKSMPGFAAAASGGPAADTLVAAYLLAPERPERDLRLLAEVDESWCVPPPDGLPAAAAEAVSAAATQAVLARRLAAVQEPRLHALRLGRLYREVELPLVRVLALMEWAGIRLDSYRLGEITARLREQVDELADRIHELAGEPFTIGSPKQLAEVLFSRLGLQPLRKGKTGYSTDARTLASLRDEHPIVPVVEEWRELTKLLNTYLEPLPTYISDRDGRLHTTFNQTVAATGRLSSTDPNLQNIPARTALGAEIRGCFVADEGSRLVVADYSQIELRLMASFADEPALLDAFRRGEDVHRTTAAAVAGIAPEQVGDEQRARAKATNFGIMYGLSAFGLSQQVGMSVEEARDFIAAYFDRYPRVRAFRDRVILEATEEGCVTTVLGRRRAIPELRSGVQHVRALGERLAVNTILQGSAADIMKMAMIAAQAELERRDLRARMLLQVHDELVFEAPEAEVEQVSELARSTMSGAWELDPPLEVHVGSGPDWRDAK